MNPPPEPKLTEEDVKITYLHLHDTQHPAWVKAKDMNRAEKELLRTILEDCGVPKKLWDTDIVKPIRSMAQLRLETPSQSEFDCEHRGGDEDVDGEA